MTNYSFLFGFFVNVIILFLLHTSTAETEISCEYPRTPKNGFIRELNSTNEPEKNRTFPYGFTLTYGCIENYQIVGTQFSSCLETGWIPDIKNVKCKKIMCPRINVPDNGYYLYTSGSGRHIGDTVQFGCYYNFKLSGSEIRECLDNGQWSGNLAKCVGNTFCPDPGTPFGGYKIGNNYNMGAVVEFECYNGQTLIGSKRRECLGNGTWSGTEVLCRRYTDFDRPQEMQFRLLSKLDSAVISTDSTATEIKDSVPPEFRKLPPTKKFKSYGRMLDLSYNRGNLVLYFLFDASTSIGPKSFNLSIDFVKALVKRVKVNVDGVRVGFDAFSDSRRSLSYRAVFPIEYSETEGVLDALERLKSTYTGGSTNIYGALEMFETVIHPVLNIVLNQPKKHIFLLTDGNYNTGGDPTVLATKMKERGVEFSCVAVSGKREINTKFINRIASVSSNVYTLKDYDDMQWLLHEVLTDKIDYSRCGVSVSSKDVPDDFRSFGRIYGGTITKTYWPWMAVLEDPSHRSPKMKEFCGGSLIDRKWVLTAAHCMYYHKWSKRENKDIQVRLGYTSGGNYSFTQTIASRKIFTHEAFSFETYDADVALIMLDRPADYEKRIRPVCLSPTEDGTHVNSTLYREGSAGWAIGYGKFKDEGVNLEEIFRDLREVSLDIGTQQKCVEGLKDPRLEHTRNMICAGGSRGEDTCSGDGGGPFMKHQYNADGEGYWVQTGITSFSPGKECGLAGAYGYFTKVAAVREWIDRIISTH